ncbi:MAG: RNA-binding S4 domain-containing protein [Fidelibacterota bacterium]
MGISKKIRIDKWLYAVRLFKTRSQATDACNAGKVKIEGERIKPSKNISMGEIITIQRRFHKQTCKVLGLIEKRVSAKVAINHVEDLTPHIELEIKKTAFHYPVAKRSRGQGRPTKKERRILDKYKDLTE